MPYLISDVVGEHAECYPLDNHDNVLWYSNVPTNPRFAYYFEGMIVLEVPRFSKALVVSLGPVYWDENTLRDWLQFYDKKNPYFPCYPKFRRAEDSE